jgi:hypothetical protein
MIKITNDKYVEFYFKSYVLWTSIAINDMFILEPLISFKYVIDHEITLY